MRSASSSGQRTDASRRTAAAARVLVLLAALAACAEAPSPEPAPPNVLLIVADDLGYGDLGVYGSPVVRTPHLDRLARRGIRFSQAYVSAPLCAPSRAALLTGRDANRYGYDDPGTYLSEMDGSTDMALARSEILLSQILRSAGYATGAFGKWHLGSRPGARPHGRGFDTFFGHLSGAHDYFDWGPGLWGPIFRDAEPVEEGGYLTHATAREAAAFVEAPRERPFFAYLAFTAIHPPIQVPESYVEAYAHLPQERQRRVAGMISALDEGVGRVLAALERRGIADDTFVIFLSDNGGGLSSNAPLRGGKGTLWEGGIRVPFLMRWPAGLPGGRVFAEPVSALDVVPTVVAAAGLRFTPDRPLDGVDLLPYLRGERSGPPHPELFWHWRDQWAVREGSLKLVRAPVGEEGPAPQGLYDLATDAGETRDLAAERPDAVRRLRAKFDAWQDAVGRDASAPAGPP